MESHPDQLVKVEPELAVAVSTTDVPDVYDAVPVLPFQLRLPLDGVTVPVPVPDVVSVRVYELGVAIVNVAVTLLADDIATVHREPLVLSHPDQLVNVEPEVAAAVSTTDVPVVYDAVPVLPLHERVPLDGVTVPVPVPDFVTVRVYELGVAIVNVAVTLFAADIATVHWFEVEESQPDQLVNVEPESAVAVSTTDVPVVYDAVPVLPFQERVPLDGVTVPVPVPDFVTVRVYELGVAIVNVAVTLFAADIATVHWFDVEESHPDQLVNVEPESAVAVSTTDVPDVYDAVPVLPLHERVPLDGVTVPVPVPDFVTVRVYELGVAIVNVAVTLFAADIATVHWFDVEESHPDQLVNVEPESAVAVSTTDVPVVYDAVPVLPLHERVPLDGVTVPVPVPDFVTVRVYELGVAIVNVAVTLFAADIDTVHWFEVEESHPDQLVNVEPESAVAVSTTDVPDVYDAVPMLPLHEREPLDAVTVPVPVPDFVTVRVYELGVAIVNVAVTLFAADIATVHWFDVEESHPDQLVKLEPESAVAVSTTDVPVVYDAVPVLPLHERVPLDGVTVPVPVPDFVTVRVYELGILEDWNFSILELPLSATYT